MRTQEHPKKHYVECPDSELVKQTLAGDERAFEVLVWRYDSVLTNLGYRILKDPDLVNDMLQHVYLQLYLSLETLQADKTLKGWLFRVARNRCIDELRRMRPTRFSELRAIEVDEDEYAPFELIPDSSPLPEEIAERRDMQQRIMWAIRLLPPRFRAVVFLRYVSQMSYSEIGRRLSIPESTAKTYFSRAKPFMRTALVKGQLASSFR